MSCSIHSVRNSALAWTFSEYSMPRSLLIWAVAIFRFSIQCAALEL